MEFANSIIFIKPYIPSGTPLLSPKFPIYTWKNNSRLTISTSRKLHLRPSFALYSFDPLPSKKFQISARFSRPTNRQNHLRKKLTQQQQFQQVRTLRNPILKFDRIDGSESNTDKADGERENFDNRVSLDNEYDFDGSREESRNVANNHEESGNGVKELEIELPKKPFGESINWNKLEGWVEQYKKDSEFWGVGTDPIFTITLDSKGKVEKVVLNEDEIRRRSQIEPQLDSEAEAFAEVDFKISFAKELAREMESGINVIPKNSTVAKFVSSGDVSAFTNTIQVVKSKPGLFSRMSKVGFFLLCGLLVAKAIRGFFDKKKKMEAITEKEKTVKGNVEVLDDPIESKILSFRRPQLNKEELVNSINQMKGPKGMVEYSGYEDKEFKDKIEKIRAMARNAREIEKINSLRDDELEDEPLKEFPNGNLRPKNVVKRNEVLVGDSDENTEFTSITILENDIGQFSEVSVEKNTETCDISNAVTPNGSASLISEVDNTNPVNNSSDLNEADLYSDGPACQSENSPKMKFRIMKSVEEAREYLSRNHRKVENNIECEIKDEQADTSKTGDILDVTNQENDSTILSDLPYPSENFHVDGETTEENMYNLNEETMLLMLERPGEVDKETSDIHNDTEIVIQKAVSAPPGKHNSEDDEENETLTDHQAPGTSGGNEVIGRNAEQAPPESKENWIEKNFHEFEPIVKRIGAGFQDNYHVARQKANEELDFKVDMEQLKSAGDESEFEWMKDEKLREIVFRVRDNELSGRDPFHLINEEDKQAFFSGLEKKVEQENEKLQSLHKYFHSNIENLDYGADGISLYDPPEKIIPRWKVPPAEKNPEFLNNFLEQKEARVAEGLKNSFFTKGTGNKIVNKSEESSSHKNAHLAADVLDQNTELQRKRPVSSKTVIEGSDGSSKAGKKSGKEFWQHTKKWSQGFMDSYNAETDPEVKSVMKDIGKDLDRWITEKEIQEAAELMDKLPEKGQKFIKAKLDKVKREMELFGPQAVVSKYKEYAEEKEEDYLWWLDLPIVLGIELYTIEENGEQKVGFYSLEMAADLELDPKQYHVVAFEDAGDCKNLCYIIQAHMELLGNGNAFVVARPPKDAFREAKENGFSITVIRKGQLQLNIDQTLEEVEELIQEIGSKIYHDKLMKEHGMDVNTLMKGVFGISKPTNRNKKSRRKLKRPANQ